MWRVKTVTKFKNSFPPILIYWNDNRIHLGIIKKLNFPIWFPPLTEEVLDYCDNKSFNLHEGSAKTFTKRFQEPHEDEEESECDRKAVFKQICDRGGEEDHVKHMGAEEINVVCSSVGAFQVSLFLCSFQLFGAVL